MDILEAINLHGGKISTVLTYANLSHDRCVKYLADLLEKGLVKKGSEGYVLTEKGYKFLEELKRAERLAEAFGFRL